MSLRLAATRRVATFGRLVASRPLAAGLSRGLPLRRRIEAAVALFLDGKQR